MKNRDVAFFALLLCLPPSARADSHDCFKENAAGFRRIGECLRAEEVREEKEMQKALSDQRQMADAYEPVSAGQGARLTKSQEAFLQYRQAECDYQSRALDTRKLKDKTVKRQAEEIRLTCLIGLTRQRTEWLQTQNGK